MSLYPIKLVVGLGNPGPAYEKTRHNVGAWLVETLVSLHRQRFNLETRFSVLLACIETPHTYRVARPTTYMNESGRALQKVAHFFKMSPAEILLVHDDLDLPVGQLRLKLKGGHGGHNGLRDIFQHFSSQAFPRLRIGIGHPLEKHRVTDYVLHAPSLAEEKTLRAAIEEALCYFPKILSGDFEGVMQNLHRSDHGL